MPAPDKTFTDFALRRGDNDKLKRWGGTISTETGTPVQDLQTMLKAVGVYDVAVDGDFGGQTETAVKRFQWNVRTVKSRLVHGALEARAPSTTIKVNGIGDAATATELSAWGAAGAETTGNLSRANAASFAQFQNEAKKIDNPTIGNDDLIVDAGFLAHLAALNAAAAGAHVKLLINQAFRIAGAPVGGAVVTPATKSQHLIGRAIDCNILDGAKLINSDAFKHGTQTAAAKAFVNAAKAAGLRWGGDFGTPDFVHFDDFVNPDGEEYLMRYFFNQRTIFKKQPIPAAA
jgi:peptidoglycan hydrolase-like protein with peptidoglycan-binding domain